jgi:alcohol dehydrogenase (cytochrome c)
MFRLPHTDGLLSEAGRGADRGAAISGNRLFMTTDNAHLIALDRGTGAKLWDVEMGAVRDGYSATGAPLVAGDLVISGVAGGEEGARLPGRVRRRHRPARMAILLGAQARR